MKLHVGYKTYNGARFVPKSRQGRAIIFGSTLLVPVFIFNCY